MSRRLVLCCFILLGLCLAQTPAPLTPDQQALLANMRAAHADFQTWQAYALEASTRRDFALSETATWQVETFARDLSAQINRARATLSATLNVSQARQSDQAPPQTFLYIADLELKDGQLTLRDLSATPAPDGVLNAEELATLGAAESAFFTAFLQAPSAVYDLGVTRRTNTERWQGYQADLPLRQVAQALDLDLQALLGHFLPPDRVGPLSAAALRDGTASLFFYTPPRQDSLLSAEIHLFFEVKVRDFALSYGETRVWSYAQVRR
jgi:hypothetical protein